MVHQIPQELRSLPQWVCSGPNKLPLNPRTGQSASVIDSKTWGTFEEACQSGFQNVGFVLTKDDPYTIIDLDNPSDDETVARHEKIIEQFDSYTELSLSKKGAHIIVRGSIPQGARREKVEVYSTARYMICTGNIIKNIAIQDRQDVLDILFSEMNPALVTDLVEDGTELLSDRELVEMALGAENGDKFLQLSNGEITSEYPSQSEADLALLSIIAFYTDNNEQVRRIFRMSSLGKREKAVRNDKYIDYALSKIRAKQPMRVEIEDLPGASDILTDFDMSIIKMKEKVSDENLRLETEAKVDPFLYREEQTTATTNGYPPGLIGDIAKYINDSAIRPVFEVGIAASIALVAGIVGRSYNNSGTGLNQYIILLAPTGTGKEGATSGIDSLIAGVRNTVPMIDDFIGPGAFASGQALIKVLDERPCFVSILGEFGFTLQQMCDHRANSNQIMLKRVFLDLYAKSGWNKVLRSSVYSDIEKNTRVIQAPCVTLLGESTPEAFFEGLDNSHIAEGLIPRFSLIEYKGKRPARNPNAFFPPSDSLVERLAELATSALATQQNNTCAPVGSNPDALKILDELDRYADKQINHTTQDIERQLWNRAHLKALKLSALLAVGVQPYNPVVTLDLAQWAIKFVKKDITTMLDRFQSGDVGEGDHRQEADIRAAVETYLGLDEKKKTIYRPPKLTVNDNVIPYTFFRQKLRLKASFKKDRRGAHTAIRECLRDMVLSGVLGQLAPQQARSKYKVDSPIYYKGESW